MNIVKCIGVAAAVVGVAACLFELKYAVGGSVTGLRGSGLVLADNSGKGLTINANGSFVFSGRLTQGSAYSVTVATQPANPTQTCTVHNGSGTVAKIDVGNVLVTCTQAGRYAYVANSLANSIAAFSIDSTNGFLTPVAGSPFPSIGTTPSALVVDPNGAFLYTANNGSNNVSVFSINNATGALTSAGTSLIAGSTPADLLIDPSGRYLYVANAGDNTVSAFALQNGVATPITGAPYAVGRQPSALATDASGLFLFVTAFQDGDVAVFSIDSTSGALTGVSGSPFPAAAGAVAVAAAPAAISSGASTGDATSPWAYVANADAASLSSYSIAATGALAATAGSPLATGTAPESIAVDPAGNYLYVANVTRINSIASYAVTPGTGALTLSATAGAGGLPLAVAVDPAGQFVYSANYQSGTVSVFAVDPSTGALTEATGSPFASGAGARALAID